MMTQEQKEVIAKIIDKHSDALLVASELISSLINRIELTSDEHRKLVTLQTDIKTLQYYNKKAIKLMIDL